MATCNYRFLSSGLKLAIAAINIKMCMVLCCNTTITEVILKFGDQR